MTASKHRFGTCTRGEVLDTIAERTRAVEERTQVRLEGQRRSLEEQMAIGYEELTARIRETEDALLKLRDALVDGQNAIMVFDKKFETHLFVTTTWRGWWGYKKFVIISTWRRLVASTREFLLFIAERWA